MGEYAVNKIIVDTREQQPLSEFWETSEYIIQTLHTADYANDDKSILVECKQVGDFINCCGKGKKRFTRELERGFNYLVIYGQINDIAPHLLRVNSSMTPQYIIHCLKNVHEKYGVQVIFTSREEAASIIKSILC